MGDPKELEKERKVYGLSKRLVWSRYLLRHGRVKPPDIIVVDFWSSSKSSDRLECRSTLPTLTNIFVGMLMLSMLGIYGGMFYYVRRAA
jgi:hypothetical protein